MRAECINPFIQAATKLIEEQTGLGLTLGSAAFDSSRITSQDLNVVIGLIGKLSGSLTMAMSEETAKRVASAMVKASLQESKLVGNTIVALVTAITEDARPELHRMGFDCFSMPPMVVTGKGVRMTSPAKERLGVCLNSKFGQIELKMSFCEPTVPRVS